MPDLSQISTEELLKMRNILSTQNDLSNIPTEELLKMRGEIPKDESQLFTAPSQITSENVQERKDIEELSTQRHNQYMADYYKRLAEKEPPDKPDLKTYGAEGIYKRKMMGLPVTTRDTLLEKAKFYEQDTQPAFRMPKDLPEAIGGTIGGIAGLRVGHPIVGAGLGGAAGEALYQIDQALTASENAPDTSVEAALRMLKAGGRQTGIEAVTGLPFRGSQAIPAKGTKFFGRPISRAITPKAEKASEYFAKYGGKFTPGQLSESFWIDLAEGASESAIVGGGKMRAFKLGEKQIAENMVDTIAKTLGTEVPPEISGKAGQELLGKGQKLFRAVQTKLYDKFDDLAQGGIDIRFAKQRALEKGGEYRPLVEVPQRQIISGYVKPETIQLPPPRDLVGTMKTADLIASLPDKVPASWWNKLEQELGRQGYPGPGQLRDTEQGLMQYFNRIANEVFDKAATSGELPKEALSALKRARKYSAAGYDVFNADIIHKLAKDNPEFFASTLIQTKSITDVRKIKHIFRETNPKAFDEIIRPRYITSLLTEQAKVVKTGETSGATLKSILHPKTGAAPVKEILGSAIYDELDMMAQVLVMQQARPPLRAGSMAVMLRQPGAIIQLVGGAGAAYGGLSPAARMVSGSIALGPPVMSRLFTSPLGIRLITKGITTDAATREGADIVARILQIVGPEVASPAYQMWQNRALKENQQ